MNKRGIDVNWNLFWNAFGAIGTTFSAIATTVAVIVALWQTKIAYRKKIKIEFKENSIFQAWNGSGLEHVVIFKISNVGNRNITLNSLSIHLDGGYTIALFPDKFRDKTIEFPYLLNIETSTEIIMRYSQFVQYLADIVEKDPMLADKKMLIMVTDSVGDEYCLKLRKTLKLFLKK